MAGLLKLVSLLSLFALGSLAQSLLEVLRQEGFTEFAAIVEAAGINTNQRLVVYAPTNAGILRLQEPGGLLPRASANVTTAAEYQMEVPPPDLLRRGSGATCSEVTGPGAVDLMSLLDDPDFVNLPPGNNASIVQKNMPKGALPVVHSGLGDTVKVVGLDIPYDNGIIRPVSHFFTLPRLLSVTLPHLAADRTLGALDRTGLIGEFDTITGITFLAPDDRAIPADLPDEALAEVLRRHLIVGLPIFTSDLVNGATYKTLAGTTVTVTVNCGDVFIGGARILAGDAIIKNGVVHTVDKLLDAPVFITTTQVQTLTETQTQTTQIVQTVQTVTTETVKSIQPTTLTETETDSTTATVTKTIIPNVPTPPPVTVTKSTIVHPPPKTVTYSHSPPPPTTVHPLPPHPTTPHSLPPPHVESTSCSTSPFYAAPIPTTFSKVTKHYTKDP